MSKIKQTIYRLIKYSEKYAKTDMVYLAKGGFWLTMLQIATSVTVLVTAIIFANFLTAGDYGTYKYILSMFAILGSANLTGMGTAVTRAIARGKYGSVIPSLKTKIKWSILGSFLSVLIAIYYYINGDIKLSLGFLICSVFLPFFNNFSIYQSILSGKKLFKSLATYQIFIKLSSAIMIICAIVLTDNIPLILLAYFLPFSIMRGIVLLKTLKKYIPADNDFDKSVISYGKHLSAMHLFGTIASNLDKLILWLFISPVALAIYTFAETAPIEIQNALKNLKKLSIPKLSQNDPRRLKETLPKKIAKLYILIIPITTIYIILAPFIFQILFPQYMESVLYSQVFSLVLLLFPTKFFDYALTAQMKTRSLYKLNVAKNIIKTLLFIILLPLFGIWGAIATILITQSLYASISGYYFVKM